MDYKNITQRTIELKNEDLALRERLVQNGQLSEGYNQHMQNLHNKKALKKENRKQINGKKSRMD